MIVLLRKSEEFICIGFAQSPFHPYFYSLEGQEWNWWGFIHFCFVVISIY